MYFKTKPMKHKIKTLQDIIDYTNEDNIDNFMKDLRIFLETVHDIRNLAESISPETVISDEFIWVDDGKNTTKINFVKTVDERSEKMLLLDRYNKFLLKNGYTDTDIISEEPSAIDEFMKTERP